MNNKTTQVLYKWPRPASYSLHESNQMLRDWKGKFFRTVLFILVFEFISYFILSALPLDEIGLDLNKVLSHVFLFGMGISTYAYVAGPFFLRFDRTRYIINDIGIIIASFLQWHFYPWIRISQCDWPQSYDQPKDVECIIFYTADSQFKRLLIFDKEQRSLANEIYHHILNKIADCGPKQLKQPRIHLNKRQHAELVLLTGILSVLMALIASYFGVLQNGARLIMYLYLPMFFGAGTIGLLGIYKTRLFQYKNWWQWIILYNTASVWLTFFFSVFMIIIELAEIIGTTS